jgi:hypothetical protein
LPDDPRSQKRAKLPARRSGGFSVSGLILPLLAVGLVLSLGHAGSGDRRADASAEQVAPAGCLERLRSPGDRPSRPAEVYVTGALTVMGAYRTVDNFYVSVGAEARWRHLMSDPKTIRSPSRRIAR